MTTADIALVVVTFLAGSGSVFLFNMVTDWWRRPIITVGDDADADAGLVIESETGDRHGVHNGHAFYARLRIGNSGLRSAMDVVVYLIDINVDGINFQGNVVEAVWSHSKHQPRTIPAGFDGFYLDLYCVGTNLAKTAVTYSRLVGEAISNRLNGPAARMRKLTFTVVVAGDNFKLVRTRVELIWNGRYGPGTLTVRNAS